MNRDLAYQEVTARVQNRNLVNHMLAVEAVMRGLAERFNEDMELWGLCGLVHDIDYEETAQLPEKHGLVSEQILAELGFSAELIYAVKVHNEALGFPRNSLLDKALYASDPVTGLITAAALVLPDKKLAEVTVASVLKKMKKKDFARGANREQIKTCAEIDLTLEEFLTIALSSMQQKAASIGL